MSKTTRRVYKIAAAAAFTAGSVAAIPATFAAEAPADQQQQVVDQKATAQASSLPGGNATETPKAEAPKTEAPKAEAPKTEAPKAEATEAPKTEATEAPKTEAPKAEAPKTEAPKAEATEAPKAETPKAEAPKTEAPKAEAPKTEAPKADATEAPKAETPAPTAPATPEPTTPSTPAPEAKQADPSIVIENAHFPGNAQLNTVSVVGTGFYGEKVGPGVQVSIYALDADNQITGEALATIVVPAEQIQDGTFKSSITVEASKLPAGASYALAAVSNPQGQPDQRLVAISSFKVTESATPAPETPKEETPAPVTPAPEAPKDETPAPVTPAPETPKEETPAPVTPAPETPKDETPAPVTPAPEAPKEETPAPQTPAAPENATLTTEDASLNPNDQYNVLTFNGSGFTHESVANGVQIAIYRLDANGNITGEALATHDIPASEIVNGTFRVKVSVLAELLQPGYAYAMVATSDPNGLVHQVAVTTATVSDANNPAPTLPAATEGDNTTVRDNGDGTTSVFTAEMREDGSVVVTETRMPTSQAPKAKAGNVSAATSSSSKGHTVGVSGTKGSTSTSSSASSKPQLANTGAEGVAGIAGVGAAALIAGAALMLLRRRSL
mgnify:CR=1 FL=1